MLSGEGGWWLNLGRAKLEICWVSGEGVTSFCPPFELNLDTFETVLAYHVPCSVASSSPCFSVFKCTI